MITMQNWQKGARALEGDIDIERGRKIRWVSQVRRGSAFFTLARKLEKSKTDLIREIRLSQPELTHGH